MSEVETILLKFSGPLQSWGVGSHFETRHTDIYPSKSAVIGMIAASMGYRRNQDNEIIKLNALDFAVRVDQQGHLLRDYHTARKYKKNAEFERTYVTNRYYLEDAIFIIAIGSKNEQWIEELYSGLKKPYFQPFMGRRSLPLPSDFLIGKTGMGTIESLKKFPWQAKKWYRKMHTNEIYIYADAELLDGKGLLMRKDRVKSFSQKERKFGFRTESKVCIMAPNEVDGEHDVFESIGG